MLRGLTAGARTVRRDILAEQGVSAGMSTSIKDGTQKDSVQKVSVQNSSAGRQVAAPSTTPRTTPALPDIELRFSPMYAWLLMGFGALFCLMGLYLAFGLPQMRGLVGGLLLSAASVGAIFGGDYWRKHLPVVVRMTEKQLVISRGLVADWTEIASIEKKSLGISRYGARNNTEWVCFKLKKNRVAKDARQESFNKFRSALFGSDFVFSPQQEVMEDADWFMAECRKRMDAAAGGTAKG